MIDSCTQSLNDFNNFSWQQISGETPLLPSAASFNTLQGRQGKRWTGFVFSETQDSSTPAGTNISFAVFTGCRCVCVCYALVVAGFCGPSCEH